MREEYLPYNFDLQKKFPSMRKVDVFEGGAEFFAEKDGKFLLIRDEKTMADLIPEDDEDLFDKMVTVLEFDSEDERNGYILRREREKTKETLREAQVVSAKSSAAAGKQSRRKAIENRKPKTRKTAHFGARW